jgi:ADP-heptose:LPS heptosyltransferase
VEVIKEFGDESFIQVGLAGEQQLVSDHRTNLKMAEVADLVRETNVWVGCDSFLQHLARHVGKPGVVVWSVSDPKIFGYEENKNLLVSRVNLRRGQFDMWEAESYRPDAFVEAPVVCAAILEML